MFKILGNRSRSAQAHAGRILDLEAKVTAMDKSQAVIEFKLDGTIISANHNFLVTVGYSAEEIVGRHHSMFVTSDYAKSAEYRTFWENLNRGEFVAEKFKRLGKGGKEIWIQASYNPMFDKAGKPFKVVKFATDITAIENERRRSEEERAAKAAAQARVVQLVAASLGEQAQGNLTYRLDDELPAEYEKIRVDFNSSMDKLQQAMQAITSNAQTIRASTEQITEAAEDLSRRTEQQAASLEETAAALDEITATVRKTAEGAAHAREVVGIARKDAEHSGEVVGNAVAAMSNIEASSRQIGQIIGVIDEIAFQTNLLALNAGVEAARAGDAGRGFAVVASEVRSLAQRSAAAAKEIKTLINTSEEQVKSGVLLVGETGGALKRIVKQVSEINSVVAEIAASAQEQAAGLAEVNTAVNQMDQVTQQNAAMVEETTAAAHSLTQETEELSRLVGRFDVDDGTVQQQASRARPRLVTPSPRPAFRATSAKRGSVMALRTRSAAATESWQEF